MVSSIKRLPKRTAKQFASWLRDRRYTPVLVLGDSHARIFSTALLRSAFPDHAFDVVSIGGATVSGMENPNSKTQALPIFKKRIAASRAKTVITLLGEVDTGFVIWYRAAKYGTTVSEMLDRALSNYRDLLNRLIRSHRVICISTPLPTIQDGQDWGEIANARREVAATQRERTDLTLTFNRRIGEVCRDLGVAFISLDEESLGPDGVVSDHLRHADPNDHHFSDEAYAALITSRLRPLL